MSEAKNINPRNGGGRQGRSQRRSFDQRKGDFDQNQGPELQEKVVFINRSSKVVKGGRRFNFSALVIVGDRAGKYGLALGKANEVADAIRRGNELARVRMEKVSFKGHTIPHEVSAAYDGARVLLRPASEGTGIIAGKTVRAVLEAVGLKDVLSKSMGSNNPANVVKATIAALKMLRTRDEIQSVRGIARKPKEETTNTEA